MHDLAFADATRPTRAVVLCLPLLTYSIGHELILQQNRNPLLLLPPLEFSKLPEPDQRHAVIQAALTCCQTWTKNQRAHRWLRLWGIRIRNENFPLSIADFRNYRAAGSSFPTRPTFTSDPEAEKGQGAGGAREFGQPLLAWLYNFVSRLPASEIRVWGDTAWDFPLGLASWLNASALEVEGAMKIENTFEYQARTELEQHQLDYAAEQAAEKLKSAPSHLAPPTSDLAGGTD